MYVVVDCISGVGCGSANALKSLNRLPHVRAECDIVRVWGPVRPPGLNSSVKSLQYAVK
jgi:hypothetical protein